MTSRILELTSLLVSDSRSELLRKYEGILWTNLLKALSASQMYIQTQSPSVNVDSVLSFLINDKDFPRSLTFSLNSIAEYLTRLPDHSSVITMQRDIAAGLTNYNLAETPAALLHSQMDELQADLNVLNNQISQIWFYPDYTSL
jgi:uncharacterized alpha-E superfamily protein